jgi:hypothetical protein
MQLFNLSIAMLKTLIGKYPENRACWGRLENGIKDDL